MTLPDSTRPLDLYDIAVLAGGLPRLVDTAIVAMVESGLVRVDSSGEFHAEVPSSRHPVEAALLDAIGSRGYRYVDTIGTRFL
ncbi:TIGR04222 domain-containing membrane protein, partial [Arthrobacter sp. SAFR-014]|uniref:TIGR04222 domain-containing membrane protein n=1 Tax=Arthrobacter sp. SAFR-014 TaxID=3387280 RepID=UPI003F7C4B0A